MQKRLQQWNLPLFMTTSTLLVAALLWLMEPLFFLFLLAYLTFHGACFAIGRMQNIIWLRFVPTGLAVAGLSMYLLDGLFSAIVGSTLTVMFALLAIALAIFVLFSASLSLVLERFAVPSQTKHKPVSERD